MGNKDAVVLQGRIHPHFTGRAARQITFFPIREYKTDLDDSSTLVAANCMNWGYHSYAAVPIAGKRSTLRQALVQKTVSEPWEHRCARYFTLVNATT